MQKATFSLSHILASKVFIICSARKNNQKDSLRHGACVKLNDRVHHKVMLEPPPPPRTLVDAHTVYVLAGSVEVITELEPCLLSGCVKDSFAQPCRYPSLALVTCSTDSSLFVLLGKTEDLMSDGGFCGSHT